MKTFISWLFIAASINAHAQGLRGMVYGESTDGSKEALIGAVLVWEGTRSGTVTAIDGSFTIGVPPNATYIIISYIGYTTDTVKYNGQEQIDVVLKMNGLDHRQVVIVGEQSSTHISTRNPMNFQTLNEKELCKAACCNLSESFETNASIDASFADAVTGTRQIRMLGLDGRYTQMMFDNIPAVRGLASTYGLSYIPGPWVKSIYIAKGVGSVVGGYESMTGQINVAIKNPDNAERLHVNAYGGSGGRTELNVVWRPGMHSEHDHDQEEEHVHHEDEEHDHGEEGHVHHEGEEHDHDEEGHVHQEGEEHHHEHDELHEEEHDHSHHDHHTHIHPVLLAHVAMSQLRTDMNGDGFLDNPLFSNIILRNEWHIETEHGLGAQITLNYLKMKNVSGKLDYDPLDEVRSQLWGVDINTDRYEVTAKVGYVFTDKPWKSFGSQWSASWHDQKGNYGYRNYSGQQLSGRVNLLFASRIISDAHKFTTGISYMYDDYIESITYKEIPPVNLSSMQLSRIEYVPGTFFEYTMNSSEKFTLVGGIRGDYHNIYGFLFTPRLHARYSFAELTSLKFVAGRGYRTANILMDNVGILAGNRNIVLEGNNPDGMYGMDIEDAWNTGLIFTHKFKLNHREGTISIDAYRTQFINQVVLDLEQPTIARFYNLDGESFSNSAQAELQWSPIKRLDWRLAYRWLEVRTQYTSGLLDKPLVNRHRAFSNLAYETKAGKNGRQWRFDATVQWISRKRIPYTGNHDHHEGEPILESTYSENYWQLMAQVTYVFRTNVEIYVGGENLTNFMVHDAIISAENPASDTFDGSMLWGPVFGRMGYVGFRWIIP